MLKGHLFNDAVKRLKLTRILIAHRPKTIASADRVLVMEVGRIVQEPVQNLVELSDATRMRPIYPSGISGEQFEKIRALLESARNKATPRKVELYEVFCAMLSLLRSGCQWSMLPDSFPKWRTVHAYRRPKVPASA